MLINHSKKTVINLLEELDQEEKVAVLHDLMTSNPTKADFKILEHKVSEAKTILGKPKKKKINEWTCSKFWLKFGTLVKSETKVD